ncbi:MAG: carbon-nitrogen hydrolase family protein [Pseudomonadota bacterium]
MDTHLLGALRKPSSLDGVEPQEVRRDTIRIAAFQRRPLFDDVAGTAIRLKEDIAWCEDQGVQIAIFPECFLQGYSTDRQAIARRAMHVDGMPFRKLITTLSPFSTDVILGFIEQRAGGFYNSAAVIRSGEVAGVYAKNRPNEREFLPGADAPVFRKSGHSYGINICFDANFPESAKRLSDQGASLICYPLNNMLHPATADKWRDKSIENLRSRALETGCWVASSDVVGTHENKLSHGCTCIVSPDGDIVARVAEGEEGIVVCDIG